MGSTHNRSIGDIFSDSQQLMVIVKEYVDNLRSCAVEDYLFLISKFDPQMKYTQATLDKFEKIVEETGYVIRYERGTFQSGYCILEQKKVVVLNKFLQTEGRINTLIDLIPQLDVQVDLLSDESKKLFTDISSKFQPKSAE
jgi:hypothetical protein